MLVGIKRAEDLLVGEYYILEDKRYPEDKPIISMCRHDGYCFNEPQLYFENRIWATNNNPQAFVRWKITGPIDVSEILSSSSENPND